MASAGDGGSSSLQNEEEILVESYGERLIGLTEMFPDSLRNAACRSASISKSSAEWLWGNTKTVVWVVMTSALVLGMPTALIVERQHMIDEMKAQENATLLGPNFNATGQNMTPAVPQPLLPGNQTPK